MGTFRDLTGDRFGRLTAVSVGPKNRSGNYTWNCVCDCGAETTLPADHLLRKVQPVKSCGCFRNDRTREACSPNPDQTAFRLLISAYKKRARAKGLAFSLTDEQFRTITSGECHYCGTPPAMVMENRSRTGRYLYSSIDRKDPSQGYTEANSAPCCKTCNYMKWTLSEQEFIQRARAIAAKAQRP
jgi:hypothetical protein